MGMIADMAGSAVNKAPALVIGDIGMAIGRRGADEQYAVCCPPAKAWSKAAAMTLRSVLVVTNALRLRSSRPMCFRTRPGPLLPYKKKHF